MASAIEEFNAQWRASAHEAVPYTNDFPECFLVLPELLDGAIGQGSATKVIIEIKLNEIDNMGYLKVTDNGKGIKNPTRLLSWASKESSDMHHRYGHGSKKCLTKWNKDYNAQWYVKYRFKRTKGVDSLFTYKSPFKGVNTECILDDDDETELMPSGLEWYIEFNKDILNNYNSAQSIFNAIKEIIRTRYSRKHLNNTEFIVRVMDGVIKLEESSKINKWTTFEEAIKSEIVNNNCTEVFNEEIIFNDDSSMSYRVYYLSIDGGKSFNLKKEFPTYGQKNMNCSRIHISLNERIIEIAPFWKFIKGKDTNHNDFNGIFGFVNFENTVKIQKDEYIYKDNLPTPCTTKVSFYENCKNFIKMKEILYEKNPPIINSIDVIKALEKEKKDKEKMEKEKQEKLDKEVLEKELLNNIVNKPKTSNQIDSPKTKKIASKSSTKSKSKINIIDDDEPVIVKTQVKAQSFTDIKPIVNNKQLETCDEVIIDKEPIALIDNTKNINKTDNIDNIDNIDNEPVADDNDTENDTLSKSSDKLSSKSSIRIMSPKSERDKTKSKQGIPSVLKSHVWDTYIGRDLGRHKCFCCKKNNIYLDDHHCGHVKSKSRGGEDTIENLRPICSKCNLSMGSQNMVDFVKKCGYYIG
jgi:5-methylcytosine-specific restriction endonuclease McrA